MNNINWATATKEEKYEEYLRIGYIDDSILRCPNQHYVSGKNGKWYIEGCGECENCELNEAINNIPGKIL